MSDELINVGQSARKKLRDMGGYHAEEVVAQNITTKFRDDFGGTALNTAKWELVGTGAGMAVTFPGGTTSYLNINSGVTANSETIIRALPVFQLPVRLNFGVSASQRIANSEFFIELIECNAAGLPITSAANQTNAGTYPDYAAIKFDGTSATSALVIARGGGAPETVSAASTITTTAAGGAGPNFTPANLLEAQVSGDHVTLNSAAVDTTSAATMSRRLTQSAPDPDAFYRVQIRVRNLATSPSSATDWRLHFVRLQGDARMVTEIAGGAGNNSGAGSIPVVFAGTPAVSTNEGTLAAGTGYVLPTTGTTHLGVVKNAAGNIMEITGRNPSASPIFFKFFNKSTNPVLGTDIPLLTIPIAAGATLVPPDLGRIGKRFSAGIAIAVTGALADLDTAAGPAGAHISLTFV